MTRDGKAAITLGSKSGEAVVIFCHLGTSNCVFLAQLNNVYIDTFIANIFPTMISTAIRQFIALDETSMSVP